MISVMRNTYTLFRRNKEMIYLITIQPVMIFLLMSFLLPYRSTHDIVVAKESDSEAAAYVLKNLQVLEGIGVREIDADKITERLIGGNAELAVLITDPAEGDLPQVDLISIEGSEVEDAVELSINESLQTYRRGDTGTGAEVYVNSAPKKWLSISNSLAFMIFKTLTAGNLLGALIIEERRNRMKDRILLSGVKKSSYLLGMALVYLAFMMIGSVSYYLVGLLLNFDFGMRNSLGFLLMLFISNILSVSIYVFFAALLKKEDALGFVGTFILMPMSLFSGVLFPFKYMPQAMQRIGSFFPQRWIAYGIEKMQQSGNIRSCFREAAMVLVLSVILFLIGMSYEVKNKSKRRIIK